MNTSIGRYFVETVPDHRMIGHSDSFSALYQRFIRNASEPRRIVDRQNWDAEFTTRCPHMTFLTHRCRDCEDELDGSAQETQFELDRD
jgi:hypothetical protein